MRRFGRAAALLAVLALLMGVLTVSASSADKADPRAFGFEEDGSIPDANIVDGDVYFPLPPGPGFITGPYVGRNEIGDGAYGSGGAGTGDYDFYGLFVPGGSVLTVDIDAAADGTGLDPRVWLYDASGTILADNDDAAVASETSGALDSHLEYFVPAGADGMYFASVGAFGFGPIGDPFDPSSGLGAASEGEYEIHISVIPTWNLPDGPVYLDGTRLLVQDTSSTTSARSLFRLENNGAVRFQFQDTNSGITWQFQIGNNGAFGISLQGSGGPEFQAFPDGSFAMGPGPAQTFNLDANGNLVVDGTITDGNGNTLSGAPAEVAELLDRIEAMERELVALREIEARFLALEEALAAQD